LLEAPVELLGDIDLLHSLGRFFDRAAYSGSLGYETAQRGEDTRAPLTFVVSRAKS
jgi:hypothetical protein